MVGLYDLNLNLSTTSTMKGGAKKGYQAALIDKYSSQNYINYMNGKQ